MNIRQLQARLYWRLIRKTLNRDPYFKEFKLANYRFIVVNRNSLVPLVWEFPETTALGPLTYGKNKQVIMEDPEVLGRQLDYYLKNNPIVPRGIELNKPNNLRDWLNEYI